MIRDPFQQQAQALLHFQHTTNTDTETCITGAIPDNSSVTDNGPVVVQKPLVSRRQSQPYPQPYPQPYHSHYSCTTDRLARRSCLLSTHFLCSISSSSRDLQPRRLLLQQTTYSKLRIISHDQFSIALRSGLISGTEGYSSSRSSSRSSSNISIETSRFILRHRVLRHHCSPKLRHIRMPTPSYLSRPYKPEPQATFTIP